MGNVVYEKPEAIGYEIAPEAGIAWSVYGREGAAGADLELDDTSLNW